MLSATGVSVVVVLLAVLVGLSGVRRVEEGHVAVVVWGGAVTDKVLDPGYHHAAIPFVQDIVSMPITMQTSLVEQVPCGTSSGIVIYYEKVEVVYQVHKASVVELLRNYTTNHEKLWIHDSVRHIVNEICSVNSLQEIYIEKFAMMDDLLVQKLRQVHEVWAPALHVITARTTKPLIPDIVLKNYEEIEAQRTELMIKEQAQKRILKKAETNGKKLISAAQKEAEISAMTANQSISERQSEAEISGIDIQMSYARAVSHADAKFDRDMQRADAFDKMLTPQFLKMQRILAELEGTRMYLGPNVPDKIVEGSVGALGAL